MLPLRGGGGKKKKKQGGPGGRLGHRGKPNKLEAQRTSKWKRRELFSALGAPTRPWPCSPVERRPSLRFVGVVAWLCQWFLAPSDGTFLAHPKPRLTSLDRY